MIDRCREHEDTSWPEPSEQRARWPAKRALVQRLAQIGQEIGARSAIEFGGGSGEDAALLRQLTGWPVALSDVDAGLLRAADPELEAFVLDVSNAATYPRRRLDLGFCSFLVHLLSRGGKKTFYREAHRILSVPGALVILTASEQDLLRRKTNTFFPSSFRVDIQRYLPVTQNQQMLLRAGFVSVSHEAIRMDVASAEAHWRLFRDRTASILRLVPDLEYHRGMTELERQLASGEPMSDDWSRTLLIARK